MQMCLFIMRNRRGHPLPARQIDGPVLKTCKYARMYWTRWWWWGSMSKVLVVMVLFGKVSVLLWVDVRCDWVLRILFILAEILFENKLIVRFYMEWRFIVFDVKNYYIFFFPISFIFFLLLFIFYLFCSKKYWWLLKYVR